MSILDTIVREKTKDVAERKSLYPLPLLRQSRYFDTPCVSMGHYLKTKNPSGIIAEFKRKSPSKGWINQYAQPGPVTLSYMQAGAAALSVLTDGPFFGARDNDFFQARDLNYCPILRKDFIVDEYQIHESKAMGADVILLIAKILTPRQIADFTQTAHDLGLEVLLEMQNENEVRENADTRADLVGINNRNLTDFSLDFENSARLASLLPQDKVKIAESGMRTAADIRYLKQAGFNGFLTGTQFMKHSNPGQACRELIKQLDNEN